MDMNQLLMMMMMNGGGGGIGIGGAPQQPQQAAPSANPMMTLGGVHPNQALMQSPLFADSAYRDASSWGTVKPSADIPSDSLMQGAYRIKNPTFMDRMARGLNGIDPNMRLMMFANGAESLGRILGGRA